MKTYTIAVVKANGKTKRYKVKANNTTDAMKKVPLEDDDKDVDVESIETDESSDVEEIDDEGDEDGDEETGDEDESETGDEDDGDEDEDDADDTEPEQAHWFYRQRGKKKNS